MLHVGNDIVDLIQPHAKTKSRDLRFLKRVFLPDEEEMIRADVRPDALLWALWSGKEAAYKCVQKDHPDAPSIPRLYKVIFLPGRGYAQGVGRLEGSVETPAGPLSLETVITHRYVHSVAAACLDDTKVVWRVDPMPVPPRPSSEFESLFVRRAAVRFLLRHCNMLDLEIRRIRSSRCPGPPRVYSEGRPTSIDISLSHDGGFAAYAFTHFPWNNKT